MKIIHRYILKHFLKTLGICVAVFTLLFLVFDFFDRIDNLIAEEASFWLVISYYLHKTPLLISQTLPIAVLSSTLLSLGLLSKNSEITAMRSAGATIFWITRPIFIACFLISLAGLLMNETLVPYSVRRVKEIYNIDIKKKDKKGSYSQDDFWWKSGNELFAVNQFDSRTNTLFGMTKLELDSQFKIVKRTDAEQAVWIDPVLGWSMRGIKEYRIDNNKNQVEEKSVKVSPLPIKEQPRDFFSAEADPLSMSYSEMKLFIDKQRNNGIDISSYLADLQNKISFPFISLVTAIVALPFALKPARSGSMAASMLAGLALGFTYYAVHSFSLAMGRAEIWPPLLAAWMANLLMGLVALIFNLGAESPS